MFIVLELINFPQILSLNFVGVSVDLKNLALFYHRDSCLLTPTYVPSRLVCTAVWLRLLQHALRLLAFHQTHKVLGMDPLPSPAPGGTPGAATGPAAAAAAAAAKRFPRKRRRTNSTGDGAENVTGERRSATGGARPAVRIRQRATAGTGAVTTRMTGVDFVDYQHAEFGVPAKYLVIRRIHAKLKMNRIKQFYSRITRDDLCRLQSLNLL